MAHRFQLVKSFAMDERLARITAPTLIMAGDRDLLVSQRSLTELSEGIRRSRLVSLQGCGHLAFATRPERVAEEVRRFLADPD